MAIKPPYLRLDKILVKNDQKFKTNSLRIIQISTRTYLGLLFKPRRKVDRRLLAGQLTGQETDNLTPRQGQIMEYSYHITLK